MSSCISSRACGFDLEHMINWTCSSRTTTNSNSSSPISSTLSKSSNSPVTISTQKQRFRTRRKRPNQTYNEAAALLSMASPNIFRITQRRNQPKFTKHHVDLGFFTEPPELITPFRATHRGVNRPCCLTGLTMMNGVNSCRQSAGEAELNYDSLDDFDTESILNEEMEQGIDSIMGDCKPVSIELESNDDMASNFIKSCYGYPMGLGFGVRNALRNGDERNWWSSPMVDVVSSSPAGVEKSPVGKVKKKKKKRVEEVRRSKSEFRLKLDYDGVLNEWADRGLPLPDEISHSFPGGDIHARAANIDLFSEKGGWNESSVTHLMDNNHLKKIRRLKCKVSLSSTST